MLVPLAYNLRSLSRRRVRTALTVAGIGAVVAVYVVMSAVSGTMRAMFKATGQPDEVLVTQPGALTPEFSFVPRPVASWLKTLDAVAVDASSGEPLVSPELTLSAKVSHRGVTKAVALRGVSPVARAMYREPRLLEGDWVGPGKRVMVGKQLARALGLGVGDVLAAEKEQWTVAGVFEAGGTLYEQEVWLDLDELGAASSRTELTSLLVRVKRPALTRALVDELSAQRRQPLQAMAAHDAYARVGGMSLWMASLGQFIALVIALGAVFGGMNTMYAAVAGRQREIGILRALGYRSGAVLLSFLTESAVVGLVGGALGVALALVIGQVPLTMPYLVGKEVAIGTGPMVSGLVLAGAVGLLGGLLPAWQAARVRVVEALR
jgi:putative ABC transport system permease protein